MRQTASLSELTRLVTWISSSAAVCGPMTPGPVAETIVAAERDGSASHRLLRAAG
jgi:hypothetical protein